MSIVGRRLLSCIAVLVLCFGAMHLGVPTGGVANTVVSAQAQTLTEGFESGSKSSYTSANVTLGSGVWNMNDALIGNLSTDRRTGAASARIRNTGTVSMLFDLAGAGTVTIQHALFGTDGSSSWELWFSVDGGAAYSKLGATINTASTSLQTATFIVNVSNPVRIQIRKVSGGANRINLDNISISDDQGANPPPDSEHLTLGNPSNAIADVNNPLNFLMIKDQYAMSYNRDRGEPNWVSWHLSANWLGSAPRQNDFRADTTLPAGWYRVLATDYSGSGFDRGHMCPSADRTITITDNSATFLMSNMIPQAPDNNQGPWADLENYCRSLISLGNELYIISGGDGSNGTVANGRVAVPTFTWKVIVVLPEGSNDVARVSTSTRVIAIDMPNTQGIRTNDWRQYRTTVHAIESFTGFNFLSSVPTSVQNVIENVVDNQ